MTRLTTSTLALIIAGSTALADNHGDEEMSQSGMSENGQAEQTTGMAGDADMSDDMANDDAADNARMTEGENTASADMTGMQGDLIRTRDITGGNIYTVNEASDEGWNATDVHDEVGADWNTIGEIEDVVLSRDGQVTGIVAEVGGFLDIADKHVLISVDDLNLVAVDDATYGYVTRQNEEDLEAMESVDEGFWN
ncbi:PRC-barrel domain-containing protein [Roseovarius sp.]|uniref:PRC-barrel domain-containing protein n=1 Tax=Roseovarius sp. TaxID=1486281 RepID=UPI003456E5C4